MMMGMFRILTTGLIEHVIQLYRTMCTCTDAHKQTSKTEEIQISSGICISVNALVVTILHNRVYKTFTAERNWAKSSWNGYISFNCMEIYDYVNKNFSLKHDRS